MMAAGFTPVKGTQYAPCEPTCEHTDCAAWRRQIDHPCRFCAQPIGYDARVYQDDANPAELVHADCLEDSQRDHIR